VRLVFSCQSWRMASEAIGTALELIKSVDACPKSPVNDWADGNWKCRPGNVDDFKRRLRTFQVPWWFNKPLCVSPIECARRGWVNAGEDTLSCELCSEEAHLERTLEGWLVNGSRVSVDVATAVHNCHSGFCPWRSHEVNAVPSQMSEQELCADIDKRLASLQPLKLWPVLADGFKDKATLTVLARAGWEYAGTAGAGSDSECIRCSVCLRVVAVESFQHEFASSSRTTDSGEPSPKVQRLEAGHLPPRRGLWSPKHSAFLDPYECHHFYCPLYSRIDDGLTDLARHLIRGHAAFAVRADPASGTGDPAERAGDTASTVQRAEEVLRMLDTILPPS